MARRNEMKKITLFLLLVLFLASGCTKATDNLTLEGTVQNNILSSNTTVGGKIIEMIKGQGERVIKGDILAVIDSTNQQYSVEQLSAVVRMKQEVLEGLNADTRSYRIAQADLEQSTAQLKQAQNIFESYNIKAPADGIIISKIFDLGDIVTPGSNIADVAVSGDVYVLCYIPDKYLDKITYGQPLKVSINEKTQNGKVSFIALENEYVPIDKQSTTDSGHKATKIKVSIDDNKGLLKSGMTATVIVPLK